MKTGKAERKKQHQLLHNPAVDCLDPKGRNPLSCAGRTDRRKDRVRQTKRHDWRAPSLQVLLTQTSSLFLGASLVCFCSPLAHPFWSWWSPICTKTLSAEENFLGVVTSLGRLLSAGLPYLFVGRRNPASQYYMSS